MKTIHSPSSAYQSTFGNNRCSGAMESSAAEEKRKLPETAQKQSKRQKTSKTTTVHENLPLAGLAFAVTTLDIKGGKHYNDAPSYKAVVAIVTSLGAKATGQVHKGLTGVICNPSAVHHQTQRVRKAIKRGLPLISVDFLHACQQKKELLDFRDFELKVENLKTDNRSRNANNISGLDDSANADAINILTQVLEPRESQWSEPVGLGCCCICHEENDDTCPWCNDCDINKAKNQEAIEGTVN